MNTPRRPAWNAPLDKLAAWCLANNNDLFDTGDFPSTDELTMEEQAEAREEYNAIADEIEAANALDQ